MRPSSILRGKALQHGLRAKTRRGRIRVVADGVEPEGGQSMNEAMPWTIERDQPCPILIRTFLYKADSTVGIVAQNPVTPLAMYHFAACASLC